MANGNIPNNGSNNTPNNTANNTANNAPNNATNHAAQQAPRQLATSNVPQNQAPQQAQAPNQTSNQTQQQQKSVLREIKDVIDFLDKKGKEIAKGGRKADKSLYNSLGYYEKPFKKENVEEANLPMTIVKNVQHAVKHTLGAVAQNIANIYRPLFQLGAASMGTIGLMARPIENGVKKPWDILKKPGRVFTSRLQFFTNIVRSPMNIIHSVSDGVRKIIEQTNYKTKKLWIPGKIVAGITNGVANAVTWVTGKALNLQDYITSPVDYLHNLTVPEDARKEPLPWKKENETVENNSNNKTNNQNQLAMAA